MSFQLFVLGFFTPEKRKKIQEDALRFLKSLES